MRRRGSFGRSTRTSSGEETADAPKRHKWPGTSGSDTKLPQAENEVRAFRRLRVFIRTSSHLARLQDGGKDPDAGLAA